MEYFLIGVAIVVVIFIAKSVVIVPQQNAYLIERLGKYHATFFAGIGFPVPFLDRIAYKHTLKEIAIDIPEQVCITRDNVQVGVDGVLFVQVVEPRMASYGIANYVFAISQLAEPTEGGEMVHIPLPAVFIGRLPHIPAIVGAINDA